MREDSKGFDAYARLLAGLLMLCACAAAGRAQQRQQQPRLEQKIVYLPDVAGAQAASGAEVSLTQLATNMLQLRLKGLRGVRVVREKAPECAAAASRTPASQPPQNPAQAATQPATQAQAQTQEQTPAPPPAAADYYEIRSSIAARGSDGSEPELVLDYELVKYARCASTSVIRRSEPFVEKSALQSLTLMSDVLALTMEEETAPPKLVVEVAEFTGGGEPRRQLRAQLAEQVASQLAALGGVQPRLSGPVVEGAQPADYRLTAAISTSQPNTVTFTVRSRKGGAPLSTTAQRIPAAERDGEAMARFYAEAAERAVRLFTSQRLIDELSFAVTRETIEATWLKAQALMCVGMQNCDVQPPVAISVLAKLAELPEARTPARLELLGDAYRSAGDSSQAALAYDAAWRAAPDTAAAKRARIPLLKKAGEAWYEAKSFDTAAERIGQAIQISTEVGVPVLPAVYQQWARSHVFANNRVRALESIIKGMRAIPRNKDLDDAFDALLKELKDAELIAAAPLMRGNRDLPEVEDEMSAFTKRFVKELLEEATLALAEGRLKAADDALNQINVLPPAEVLNDQREDARSLRGQWQRLSGNANRPPGT